MSERPFVLAGILRVDFPPFAAGVPPQSFMDGGGVEPSDGILGDDDAPQRKLRFREGGGGNPNLTHDSTSFSPVAWAMAARAARSNSSRAAPDTQSRRALSICGAA